MKTKVDDCLIEEASMYVGVSKSTLVQWDNTGYFPAKKASNGYRIYRVRDLIEFRAFLESQGYYDKCKRFNRRSTGIKSKTKATMGRARRSKKRAFRYKDRTTIG